MPARTLVKDWPLPAVWNKHPKQNPWRGVHDQVCHGEWRWGQVCSKCGALGLSISVRLPRAIPLWKYVAYTPQSRWFYSHVPSFFGQITARKIGRHPSPPPALQCIAGHWNNRILRRRATVPRQCPWRNPAAHQLQIQVEQWCCVCIYSFYTHTYIYIYICYYHSLYTGWCPPVMFVGL
jgi:hypothetical protein